MTSEFSSDRLLIIFTRNPVLGKCKTRLAATIGDKNALEVYQFLLNHTQGITSPLPVDKIVYYSEFINQDDIWDPAVFEKQIQAKGDLGKRIAQAFQSGFAAGYKQIVLIGSDVYDLHTADLDSAFQMLIDNEVVIGPAEDGGYYLIGLNQFIPEIFQNKEWGKSTVLKDTLQDLNAKKVFLLPVKNDVDVYEDIENIPAFSPFLIDLRP